MSKKFIVSIFFILSTIIIFSGCQQVFTTSLFGVLQPAASEIPPDQLADYCQDVLTNGTDEEKAEAFAALQEAINAGSTDPEINYVAANLALDQAGLTIENIVDAIDAEDPAASIEELLSGDSLDLLIDAGGFLVTALEGGAELTATDYALSGTGIILESVGGNLNDAQALAGADPASLTPEQQQGLEYIEYGGETLAGILGFGDLFI